MSRVERGVITAVTLASYSSVQSDIYLAHTSLIRLSEGLSSTVTQETAKTGSAVLLRTL